MCVRGGLCGSKGAAGRRGGGAVGEGDRGGPSRKIRGIAVGTVGIRGELDDPEGIRRFENIGIVAIGDAVVVRLTLINVIGQAVLLLRR